MSLVAGLLYIRINLRVSGRHESQTICHWNYYPKTDPKSQVSGFFVAAAQQYILI